MRIIRARALGMCFGVRDALDCAARLPRPHETTIHGELVHNPAVLVHLESRGYRMSDEQQRSIPPTPTVMITAHGISHRERDRLQAAGKILVDTTCPLVRRVHRAAQELEASGYHVVIIGRAGHVEVRGIVEDLADCSVVGGVAEVIRWPHTRLGIICQSTTPPDLAQAVGEAIAARNPQAEIRQIPTICQPTRDRQEAVEDLCRLVDVVVVVGGAHSNNTRQLVELARRQGTPAFHVESASDLRAVWFHPCDIVGLTAGTSTLDETIQEVHLALSSLEFSDLAFPQESP